MKEKINPDYAENISFSYLGRMCTYLRYDLTDYLSLPTLRVVLTIILGTLPKAYKKTHLFLLNHT